MKKRVQRILTLFLASALLFASVPADALYASEDTAVVEDTEEQTEEDVNSEPDQAAETEENGTKENATTDSEDNASTEAGQQDEHPADALLPQPPRPADIPVHPDAEQEHHVPAGMVQHHADQIQPAQFVQQGVAARRGLLLHSSFVFHYPYSPLLCFAIRYDKL